jgi:hypothetical protein
VACLGGLLSGGCLGWWYDSGYTTVIQSQDNSLGHPLEETKEVTFGSIRRWLLGALGGGSWQPKEGSYDNCHTFIGGFLGQPKQSIKRGIHLIFAYLVFVGVFC